MGVHVMHDSDDNIACLYCSTDGLVRGRVFGAMKLGSVYRDANEIADAFLFWYARCGAYRDPRVDPRLAVVQDHFLSEVLPHMPAAECGQCGAEPYEHHRRWCEASDWRETMPKLEELSPLGPQSKAVSA